MNFGKTMSVAAGFGLMVSASMATPIFAQSSPQTADISPLLLIETGPSDNADYRRMVFVKYISGNAVTVAYKAYNRAEFIQVPDTTPDTLIQACLNGPATTLEDIEAYQLDEAEARDESQTPAITHFCIKGVSEWEAGNRSIYLDPIFEGMPHAAALNN